MISENQWHLTHSHESYFDNGPLGVKIHIAVGHEPTEEEIRVTQRIGEQVYNELWKLHTLNDPVKIANAAKEKEDILKCFGPLNIFVEEIPNGYCSEPCCVHLPWFVVTTPIGHIKIGWRKRVINIDWSETNQKKQDLFPNENVTKGEDYIHAFSYEDAKRYIEILHGE